MSEVEAAFVTAGPVALVVGFIITQIQEGGRRRWTQKRLVDDLQILSGLKSVQVPGGGIGGISSGIAALLIALVIAAGAAVGIAIALRNLARAMETLGEELADLEALRERLTPRWEVDE